jgi:hypothetical protein
MSFAKQIHLHSQAGSLNLPRGQGWLASSQPVAHKPEIRATNRPVMTLRDAARRLRVTVKRAAAYCDPALVRVPIPHFVLPAVGNESAEARIRIYADDFNVWLGGLARIRSAIRRDQSASS